MYKILALSGIVHLSVFEIEPIDILNLPETLCHKDISPVAYLKDWEGPEVTCESCIKRYKELSSYAHDIT